MSSVVLVDALGVLFVLCRCESYCISAENLGEDTVAGVMERAMVTEYINV